VRRPRFSCLQDWLNWQLELHPSAIDLGLERLRPVAQALGLFERLPNIITVGGTNGKGSVVAMLEACLLASGQQVACYTSPHFLDYNERIRLQAKPASDALIMQAFAAIDGARGETTLTFFEFGTLAAVWCAKHCQVDTLVLEVGLGGRLDACNLWDADVSVVTSIGLDHKEYLGDTREAIGREKAGIYRSHRPAICGDRQPPDSLSAYAHDITANWMCIGGAFDVVPRVEEGSVGHYRGVHQLEIVELGLAGAFQLDNAASALCALEQLPGWCWPGDEVLQRVLAEVRLAGRCQRWPGHEHIILDVAHNQQAAEALAGWVHKTYCGKPAPVAVVAMLADKDHAAVVQALAGVFSSWYVAQLDNDRAGDSAQLHALLVGQQQPVAAPSTSVAEALQRAQRDNPGCDIVVFGSFYTVADAMRALR
jgi:dihydrofolate synthase/folylpolyglutamate synthase